MKDFLSKIKILYYFISTAIQMWKKEIWQRNLDERYCCNGDMCGCQGIAIRENWKDFKIVKE